VKQTGGEAKLEVQGGDGLLARRASALLFAPDAGGEGLGGLLQAFLDGSEPSAAVCKYLVDKELRGPVFVVVEWTAEVSLMVFGSLEVSTDQAALPMLSGASSTSWVEHRLHEVRGGSVAITADAPAEGSMTSLEHGVVPAGGFRLVLPAGRSAAVPLATGERAQRGSPSDLAPGDQSTAPATDAPPSELQPSPSGRLRPPRDPKSILEAALGTGEIADPQLGEVAASRTQPAVPDNPTEATFVGPLDTPAVLVEAKLCSSGHPNPVDRASCRICQALVSPTALVQEVERPSLGVLRLDDGREISLLGDVVLGRSSTLSRDEPIGVFVDDEEVSRRHVRVALEGWEVRVEDAGSTNGTFIDGDLDPLVDRRLIEHGSTVFLGSPPKARSFKYLEAGQPEEGKKRHE